jgi:PTH1 family peptidyl-tRNA hydrolase
VIDVLAGRQGLAFDAAPADALAARWRRADEVILLVKPLTFMNLSGQAVAALCRYYKVALPDVVIVCDDVQSAAGAVTAPGRRKRGWP